MKKLKCLIYSPPGHGKTTILRTLLDLPTELMPTLIIDFEGGVNDSIGKSCNLITVPDLKNRKPTTDKIDCVHVVRWADFEFIYDYITDNAIYKTLCFDSLSEIHQMNLVENTNSFKTNRPPLQDLRMPKIQDYGNSSYQMNIMIRTFRDLDVNIIATAGVTKSESVITGREKLMPAMVGQFKEKVGHLFNIVGYLAVCQGDETHKIGTRALIVKASESYEAKFRDEDMIVEEIIYNPTLPLLYKLFNGLA